MDATNTNMYDYDTYRYALLSRKYVMERKCIGTALEGKYVRKYVLTTSVCTWACWFHDHPPLSQPRVRFNYH